MTDIDYMKLAYELARKGKGKTSPNPMVGAVIVKNGKIVGQGYHKVCGGPHAEIFALKEAGRKAKGAKLYVTLEPCFHYGRTPPCVDTVIASGIKEIFIGTKDPNPLVAGKSIRKLKKFGLKVTTGILRHEIVELNVVFNKYITRGLPFVVTKTAQTLDGKIATKDGESKWITSLSARKFGRKLRNDFDAIMIGSKTAVLDNPKLDATPANKRLKKIIVDSKLAVPLTNQVFTRSRPENCIVAVTGRADKGRIEAFGKKEINIIICPAKNGRVDLAWLMKELARREISSVLIEGGGELIGGALAEGLVDRMMIFIAPKIMGDASARSSVSGRKVSSLSDVCQLKVRQSFQLGEDWAVEAEVVG